MSLSLCVFFSFFLVVHFLGAVLIKVSLGTGWLSSLARSTVMRWDRGAFRWLESETPSPLSTPRVGAAWNLAPGEDVGHQGPRRAPPAP